MTGIEVRELRTADELAVLPEFERFVWGSATEMVSVNVLVATIQEGGMALGAFVDGEIIGMVYGFATSEPHVLHSHYLAVHPAWRNQGLGASLKLRQREWCLAHGFTAMRWTFDPLQLANAHLNLSVLGAVGVAYHPNLYGTLGGINGSLPSDRLLVQWELVGDAPERRDELRVSVPDCTVDDIATSSVAAIAARLVVRRDLTAALDDGWFVVGIDRNAREYVLGRHT